MNQADKVRKYVLEQLIEPARQEGKSIVRVKAGDVHKALGFNNSMPLVCGALDAKKFLDYAKVQKINRSGPRQSSSVVWVFGVDLESAESFAEAMNDDLIEVDADTELAELADHYTHQIADGEYNEATRLVAEGLSILISQNLEIINLLRGISSSIGKQIDHS